MLKLFFTFIIFSLSFLNFSQKKKIVYDFSCMESGTTNWLSDMEKSLIESYGSKVSLKEEKELGDELEDSLNSVELPTVTKPANKTSRNDNKKDESVRDA